MTELKPCKVCDYRRGNLHGLVAASLNELKTKGCEALGLEPRSSVCLVLEDDGTVVEDESYFLCLPSNTKFMLLCDKERWAPHRAVDGGTAWLCRESFEVDSDTVDAALSGTDTWRSVASRLRMDLASVLLMSEAELQSVVDAPCSDLASVLGFRDSQAQALQDSLQRALDRREEERQSRDLLELYLKAVERDGGRVPSGGGETVADEVDSPPEETSSTFSPRTLMVLKGKTRPETRLSNEVDSPPEGTSSTFSPRTLMVLKGKTRPETRLSNMDLQKVVKVGKTLMATELGIDMEKSTALVAACEGELRSRLERVQALRSLSTLSQQARTDEIRAKKKK